jgi:DNA-directed RNA polymerase specialized sigma24 family protein
LSNIPEARRLLNEASSLHDWDMVQDAIKLLDRKKPDFVAKRKLKPLTDDQRMTAKAYRRRGYTVHEIAQALGTNIGRVSEAINAGH